MAGRARSGPWLVALGAALWGTESLWRIPLNERLPSDVIVFWEHVILVALALPWIVPRLGELRRVSARAMAWLIFSGIAGSAVGTVLFQQALAAGDNATVLNVVLNIQPVISTAGAVAIFHDRLARSFYPFAALAVAAGVVVAINPEHWSVDAGIGYALGCALCWGMSTVAGRGVMTEMSLPLASGLRVVVGLVTMWIVVAAQGHATPAALWGFFDAPNGYDTAQMLAGLAVLSGGVPLVVYFAGLQRTRASIAGYFEMMQTLAGAAITWGVFGNALAWYQVVAALVLIVAVALVQRAQEQIDPSDGAALHSRT
jgi:drug/metabolite transporter (DMT)-like permease